ncbi:cytochrome c3 family protein [Carboxydothermus ferrireducens]|uniref:CXXCH cytochrome family protein n=1 Tax=Carboxydothermus ferrireducens DSM 11255 TaxID=1119529 RepID=A0ABX2R5S6_9THEO|nr:cytochrome c3 family protein [Carboxydothermus ferrireducens]NYE56519.1 putative CXXCH cytochrome family protein [Carboxydothermus ferrireducens DSM 11255]
MRNFMFFLFFGLILGVVTSTAFAAQIRVGQDYGPTPKYFNADDKAYYPAEIYLPNETNPARYRIHSNYSRNTDACAACHATHTAVGETLLQWGTVYDTCMACHDGTISTTYNVQEGEIGANGKPTYGGMFGIGNEPFLSNHLVTGAVKIFAAPGGNITGNYETYDVPDQGQGKMWDITFGCESCHSPHGLGGNARILNPNVNAYSLVNYKTNFSLKKVTEGNETFWVALSSGNSFDSTAKNAYQWVRSYPYLKGTKVYFDGTEKVEGVDYELSNSQGYTKIKVLQGNPATITASFYPALQVAMTITNYLDGDNTSQSPDSETVIHVKGINAFCGACHTDYNTENVYKDSTKLEPNGSSDLLNGKYTEAYRHQVGFNVADFEQYLPNSNMAYELRDGKKFMTCLTCHYAHGVSQSFWQKTLEGNWFTEAKSYWGTLTLVEIAGSSALKRAPNMATCETCHRKGPASEGYTANSSGSTPGNNRETSVNPSFPLTRVDNTLCQKCHEKIYTGWLQTKHANLRGDRVDCQDCHTGGSEHVKSPSGAYMDSISELNYQAQVAKCAGANCHGNTSDSLANMDYNSDTISFVDSSTPQVREHVSSKHYNVGAMTCTTCHNPHGVIKHNNQTYELKYQPNSLCAFCHDLGEFAGAFSWEDYMPPVPRTAVNGAVYHLHSFTYKEANFPGWLDSDH